MSLPLYVPFSPLLLIIFLRSSRLFFFFFSVSLLFFFFFFFQAEDGIRDKLVTGVQTCALPISRVRRADLENCKRSADPIFRVGETRAGGRPRRGATQSRRRDGERAQRSGRSEERRVGKECRSRRSPYHEKKKRQIRKRRDIKQE